MKKIAKNTVWKITAAAQLFLLSVMVILIITDPNGIFKEDVVTAADIPRYYDSEIVYMLERGKMSPVISFAASAVFVLLFSVNIFSSGYVIFSLASSFKNHEEKILPKIMNLILKISFNIAVLAVFVLSACVLTILYDDEKYIYRPYDNQEYYEFSDDSRRIVVREDWYLFSGMAYVYYLDGNYCAYNIGSFDLDEDYGYKVEFEDNGINIENYVNGKYLDTEYMPFPEDLNK